MNIGDTPLEPHVGVIRVVDGVRRKDATPWGFSVGPSPQAARSRLSDQLFILMDLTGPTANRMYRELRAVTTETYWATDGSATSALRQAVAAANRHLFQANLDVAPADRCLGGIVCAVSNGEDLFVLRSGPVDVCFIRGEQLECFSPGKAMTPLGTSRLADTCLDHTFLLPGDCLLLASPALRQRAGEAGLARVLSWGNVSEMLDGLEQIGNIADFTAFIARWPSPDDASPRKAVSPPIVIPEPTIPLSLPAEPSPAGTLDAQPEANVTEATPRVVRETAGLSLGREVPAVMMRSARSAGQGLVSIGAGVLSGAHTLLRRMLPTGQQDGGRRARSARPRTPPRREEHRTMMMVIAVAIPILLTFIVMGVYATFGEEARYRGLVEQAQAEIAAAQTAGAPESARSHWEAALQYARLAADLHPDDPVATALQAQAQSALDTLDNVIRLALIPLRDLGEGTTPRRLVTHGDMIFVLDPSAGQVWRLTLNATGDGPLEVGDIPPLVSVGQNIAGGTVGPMVDLAWVEAGNGRQTSGLVILEEDGGLTTYDPQWEGEGGLPRLSRSFLGTPPEAPVAVDTYQGRFYVLDTAVNQVRRYHPQGETYPNPPENYFTLPPRSLAGARDMAIDGFVYLLFDDGTVMKFLGGEPEETFHLQGVPKDLTQSVALAVDPVGGSGTIYIADAGHQRIVVLNSDGGFRAQFYADDAFEGLESLSVDEVNRRMYVIAAGKLYVASLP